MSEWTDTRRPTPLVFDSLGRAYVTELAWHEGDTSQSLGPIAKGDVNGMRHALGIAASRAGSLLANVGSMTKCSHCGGAAALYISGR